jgi:hypothetical protein
LSFKEKATELIEWSITCSEPMEVLPVWVLDTGRLNEKRPAYVKMAVPDDYVKNLKGDQPQDIYLLVKVPHDTHERWVDWSSQPSGIQKATGVFIEQKDATTLRNKVVAADVTHVE